MDDSDLKFDFDPLDNVDNDDCTFYNQDDHAHLGFQVMEDLRRKGKLCDVTLKVCYNCLNYYIMLRDLY